MMIRRSTVSRGTWYWNGGSVHFFRWGVHARRRHVLGAANWRQYRLAFLSRKDPNDARRILDFSMRDTVGNTTKPTRACWRFWVGFRVGRAKTSKWYAEDGDE